MSTGEGADVDDAKLVRTLGSKYSVEILGATNEAQSAQELSEQLDIPIATCYRRIEELTDAGLLSLEDSVLSDERRRVDVYRRDVDEVNVAFGDDGFGVAVEERSRVQNKLDDAWRALSDT
ncbi:MAG: winged helix-turn-helix domain-containing protein [Haloferacaceae archaeon]